MSRWNVPFLRNPYFTGREQFLSSLHGSLSAEKTVTVSQSRAISGLGGIGKTQIAIEYAYRYAREYEAVLWVQADSPEILVSDFARLAQTLELPEKEEKEQWRIVSAVKRWLQEHSGWLLILDNADDLTVIADMLPRGTAGAMLVTTRSQATGKLARSLALDKLEMSEGIRLLLRRANLLSEDEPLEAVSAATRTAAQQLSGELDGLPLALDQAAAYLEETGCSLSEYLALYRQRRMALLQRASSTASEYPYTVASTWTLSFSQVEQTDPAAADLLRFCAFLHPDAIPEEILTAGAAVLGPYLREVASEPLRLNEAMQLLRRYSLVKRDAEAKLLNLHRLVQVVLKESLDVPSQQQWAERALLAVNAAFPEVEPETWPQCERLLTQALTAVQLIEQYRFVSEEAGRLLSEMATYLRDRARYSEAEPLFQRALQIRRRLLGADHLDTARSLNALAELFRQQGRFEQAEQLLLQALAVRKQCLGTHHPDVARNLNNLAILYWQQRKDKQAELLFQQALEIYDQHLRGEHPDTARSLNGLANLYLQQRRYELVAPLYQRALLIYKQYLQDDHPYIAASLNNLAELYRQQGHHEQAEPLLVQAPLIFEQHSGKEHPDTARSMNNLASLYFEQAKDKQAESLYLQALSIYEQHLEPDHLDTAEAIFGLAKLYDRQQKDVQAEPLYVRALDIRAKLLGSAHPETQEVQNDYTMFLHKRKRDTTAIVLNTSSESSEEGSH